jgi:hypothetical protein
LVLPFGVGPNDPAIILTPADGLPASLIAYYAGFGDTVISGMVFRLDANNYDYIALVISGGVPFMATGTSDAGSVMELTSTFTDTGVPTYLMGSGGVGIVAIGPGVTFSIRQGAEFNIDGVPQGRGLMDFVSSVANTGALAAETVVLTSNSVDYITGRAYSVELHTLYRPGGGATLALHNFRKTNLAGAIKFVENTPINGGDTTGQARGIIRNISGATVTAVIAACALPFPAGTVQGIGAANTVRWMQILDIGDAADYPNIAQI